MEKINFEDIHKSEKESREKDYSILESLLGFSKLSEKQQQYIKTSLYIQQRAERGTDTVSASRIYDMPEDFNTFAQNKKYINVSNLSFTERGKYPEGEDKYHLSQLSIMGNYCHGVIEKLEGYGQGESIQQTWNYAGPVNSYEEAEELIKLSEEKGDFPFVIEMWGGEPSETNFSNRVHSALVLGRNEEGEIMMWEKSGWSMPYQIIPMRQSYEAYLKWPHWRTRQISV